ncbi:MAG: biotin carboxylase N-terminal domain-containing protein [Vulcanimicrobiota bacterium]
MPKFDTVFIANRGEIAVRVASTLRSLGIRSIAPYTEPDRKAYHTQVVDLAVPVQSYLHGEQLISLAREKGAQAVHPGYGFLSENAEFCAACQKAGLEFIGPSPDAIARMGDKLLAKQQMKQAGLPMVPSWSGPPEEAVEGARSLGYPLLVKAAAGGGGKGMRLVKEESELPQAIERARGEALKAFGDDSFFLEKFIVNPRHIEVQIFGDKHGNALCFGERECSLQRRYQKIIEEAPSLAVSPDLREKLVKAGVNAVRALNYTGAGTVEFILDEDEHFYFLEVNTRLQVEHPVTELVYGVDLVALQIAVAEGAPLAIEQSFLKPRGWAMEARVYAEDPDDGFLPSVGTLGVFQPPAGPNLRLDTGFRQGDEVSIHFDPMLAKLISYGPDREAARRGLLAGLKEFAVLGVTTNIPYLGRILSHPTFIDGEFHTQFLEASGSLFSRTEDSSKQALALALVGAFGPRTKELGSPPNGSPPAPTPWASLGEWRLN